MFDLAWSEIALIGVVALVVIGPKDLPEAIRGLARGVQKLRRMAGEFQSQADELVREANLDEVRSSIHEIRSFNIKNTIEKAVDADGSIRRTFTEDPLKADAWKPPAGGTPGAPPAGAMEGAGAAPGSAEPAQPAPPAFIPPAYAPPPPVAAAPEPAPAPAFVPPANAAVPPAPASTAPESATPQPATPTAMGSEPAPPPAFIPSAAVAATPAPTQAMPVPEPASAQKT